MCNLYVYEMCICYCGIYIRFVILYLFASRDEVDASLGSGTLLSRGLTTQLYAGAPRYAGMMRDQSPYNVTGSPLYGL